MNRPRAALAAVALTLAAVALHRACRRDAPPEPVSAAPAVWREAAPARRVYTLAYDCEEEARFALTADGPDAAPPEAPLGGAAHLRARVVLSPARSTDPRRTLQVLRLEALTQHVWRFGGRELLPDDAAARDAFDRAEILVETAADGEVTALHFREETPALARQMLRQVALEIAAVRRRDDAWDAREPAPSGVALAHYARDPGGEVTRTRAAYATLAAPPHDPRQRHVDGRWTLAYEGGALSSLEGEEHITVGETARALFRRSMRVSLRRIAEDPRAAALVDLTGFVRRRPDAPPTAEEINAQLLAQRVAGLTVDELVATLRQAHGSPTVPDHHRFFWRATGLLRLHPEAARALVPVYRDAQARGDGRMLVLDLLASAQTAEAQRTMVELLRDPVTRGDPDQSQYLQRLSFVERPEPDTVALARERFADPATRRPAAYALGAVARHLADGGDDTAARACNDAIARALDDAAPDQVAALVLGLGNTRRDDNEPRLEDYARSPRADVRQSAAAALGQLTSPDAVRALVALAGDADPRVQAEALRALRGATLPDDAWATLAAMVREGAVRPDGYGVLYEVLRAHTPEHAAGALPVARAMVDRGIDDADTRVRVLALVDELTPR